MSQFTLNVLYIYKYIILQNDSNRHYYCCEHTNGLSLRSVRLVIASRESRISFSLSIGIPCKSDTLVTNSLLLESDIPIISNLLMKLSSSKTSLTNKHNAAPHYHPTEPTKYKKNGIDMTPTRPIERFDRCFA